MKRFARGLLVLAVLVMLAAGLNGRLGELFPLDVLTSIAGSGGAAAVRIVEAADQADTAAIQQVIQRSNDEQVQAIATRDPSAMADTLTSDHYQELVQINQDLLNGGVTSIKLVKLEWGAVAIDGSSATATTYETWSTTLADGTVDQARDRNEYSLVLDNGTWKIKSDAHPDETQVTGRPGPSTTTPPPELPFPGIPDNQNTSHNWSGYAATGGGGYTSVSGTWGVPQFSPDRSFGIDAAWVGIGGVRSHDLIQAGTQQTVSGSGSTQYEAWVEMLPRSSRAVPLRVHAGDSVTVAISEESPDHWLIAFTNNTTGQTYNTTEQYASSHSSAEWVEEAPSSGRGALLPLDNFGSIAFSGGSTVKDGQSLTIAGSNARAITMLGDTNQAIAVPSGLSEDGAGFSVARTDAPATAVGRQGGGRSRRVPPPVN
ncbi:MAG: G1 family glutamic endopeptidase [Chloroflexota bacterium]